MSTEDLKPEIRAGLVSLTNEMQKLAQTGELLTSQRITLVNRCRELEQQMVELEHAKPMAPNTRVLAVLSSLEKTVPRALEVTGVALEIGASASRRNAKVQQVMRAANALNVALNSLLLMAGPHGPGGTPDD